MQVLKARRFAMVRMLNLVITLLALLALASHQALADQSYGFEEKAKLHELKIVIGNTQIITFGAAVSEQVIGNPDIADIMPLAANQAYILGKSIGSTNLTVFNNDRSRSIIIRLEVTPDIPALKKSISEIVPEASVKVRTSNGRIILTGSVPDPTSAKRILELAETFVDDPKLLTNAMAISASQQVMLEVRFLEARRNAVKALGVSVDSATLGSNVSFKTVPAIADAFLNSLNITNGGSYSIDALIDAMEQKGVTRRIAEPNLMTLSGETASFLEGGSLPYVASNEDGPNTTFQNYGVSLKFLPVVLPDRNIRISMNAGLSEPDTTYDENTPGFRSREAQTTVQLRDGQSLVIAGLLDGTNARSLSQVPWIGDLPILGSIFRSSDFQKRETELIIIITPRLVQPIAPGTPIASPLDSQLPTDEFEQFLTGKLEKNVPKPSAGNLTVPATGHLLDME